MFTYSIDSNNTVWGYSPHQVEPCLEQPQHPNGTAWESSEAAVAWAELWVSHMTTPDETPFPA